jgi:Holliday junction resolvase-like predicted endonuclease
MNVNLEEFKNSLTSIFASIPYNNYTKNNISKAEGFYASVVYVYLQSLGFDIIGEDVTNKGRIDLTIKLTDKIYIIEFKVERGKGVEEKGSKGGALKQIKEKKYHEKYLNENKDIYLVGINFSKKEKNISKFEWERI